jgi:tetratricopeptide (TPR) repeat protein
MVDNDFNQITIDNKIYKKEICCDDIELIEKLKDSGKLNPNLDNNEYIINCTKENKYVIDPIPIGEGSSSFVYNLIGENNKVLRISKLLKLSDIIHYGKHIIDEIQGFFIQYYISKKCPYICKIYEFGYLTLGNETHVYAILEKLIKSNLTGINFGETPQKYDYKIIMDQIFEGFLCIRSNNYIHKDICLNNIGIGEDKNARIFDFGKACYFDITLSDLKYLKDKIEMPDNGSYKIEQYTPNSLESINNLAALYDNIGQKDKALPLYEECFEKRKQLLGIEDPTTLSSMNYLARLYNAMGHIDKAIPLVEDCLEKRKQIFGNDHATTIGSMINLAGLYQHNGYTDKALPLYEECLEKRKQLLGIDHPDTLNLMDKLAGLYQVMGNVDKALPLYEECLEKTKIFIGNNNPTTLMVMNNLACLYQVMGNVDKALPLYEECFVKRKQFLVNDHPDTLQSMNNLANLYQVMGNMDKALPLYEECIEKKKQLLGNDHPNTLMVMNNIATLYQVIGQRYKAVPLFEECLEKRKQLLGIDHPDTLIVMNNLANLYQVMGQKDKAINLRNEYIL